ncbi:hypothetical protein CRENBAI_006469 [Crenichthys baileyi]|uniref:Uncharacterized protein n=1 Tax=Crenichthys baileyi TaxID=28760 RepID=A0AAV9S7T9_9TELE
MVSFYLRPLKRSRLIPPPERSDEDREPLCTSSNRGASEEGLICRAGIGVCQYSRLVTMTTTTSPTQSEKLSGVWTSCQRDGAAKRRRDILGENWMFPRDDKRVRGVQESGLRASTTELIINTNHRSTSECEGGRFLPVRDAVLRGGLPPDPRGFSDDAPPPGGGRRRERRSSVSFRLSFQFQHLCDRRTSCCRFSSSSVGLVLFGSDFLLPPADPEAAARSCTSHRSSAPERCETGSGGSSLRSSSGHA